MHVTFRQPGTNKPVVLKVGFSWYFCLLTPFYGIAQFLKGLWGHGLAVLLIAAIGVASLGRGGSPLFGLVLIGLAIFYGFQGNKFVARRLAIKGWRMEGDDNAVALARSKWGLPA